MVPPLIGPCIKVVLFLLIERWIFMTEKEFVKEITKRDDDFAKWYTDIVLKSELCDYSSVKGCMILRPAGFGLWENIQSIVD